MHCKLIPPLQQWQISVEDLIWQIVNCNVSSRYSHCDVQHLNLLEGLASLDAIIIISSQSFLQTQGDNKIAEASITGTGDRWATTTDLTLGVNVRLI